MFGRGEKEKQKCQKNQIEVLSRKIYNQLVIQKTNLRNVFIMNTESEDTEIMRKR